MNVPQPAGLIVVATLVAVLVVVVLVVRRRETRGPRLGTDDRAGRLELDTTGAVALEPPAGIPPGELGALVLPAARYQQVTATLLDLADRGHLTLRLWSAPLDDGTPRGGRCGCDPDATRSASTSRYCWRSAASPSCRSVSRA